MLPRRHGHVSHVRSACKAKTAESSLSKANDKSDIANEMYDDIKKGMGSSVRWKNEKDIRESSSSSSEPQKDSETFVQLTGEPVRPRAKWSKPLIPREPDLPPTLRHRLLQKPIMGLTPT